MAQLKACFSVLIFAREYVVLGCEWGERHLEVTSPTVAFSPFRVFFLLRELGYLLSVLFF